MITFWGGNSIAYTYDASGVKLRMKHTTALPGVVAPVGTIQPLVSAQVANVLTTDYVGNKVYENGTLKYLLTETGYVESGQYRTYLKDHLGNNRVVLSEDNESGQVNNFYASGASMETTFGQPFKYSGKELDGMFGLNWYDYLARWRDAVFPVFPTPDPLCEKYYSISPYAYCNNNPVNAYDLHGDSIWYTKDDNVITMHVTGKVINQSSDNINVKRAASDIASGINDAFSGEFEYGGQTYTLKTDVQLESATTMDDVIDSDHLFVLADADGKSARGATNMIGGKVMTIAASDYANDNWLSNTFSSNNTRSAVHEFGHAAGLRHPEEKSSRNLMMQYESGTNVTSQQRTTMVVRWGKGHINKGSNSYLGKPYPYVHYYDKGRLYTTTSHRALNMGGR